MRAARAIGAFAFLAASAGCTPEPGIQGSGSGSYTVTGRSSSGDAGVLIAQNAALQDARAFCMAQGRRFLAVGDHVAQEPFSDRVSYTVQFRCPPPGSPELQRPAVNQAPDDLL